MMEAKEFLKQVKEFALERQRRGQPRTAILALMNPDLTPLSALEGTSQPTDFLPNTPPFPYHQMPSDPPINLFAVADESINMQTQSHVHVPHADYFPTTTMPYASGPQPETVFAEMTPIPSDDPSQPFVYQAPAQYPYLELPPLNASPQYQYQNPSHLDNQPQYHHISDPFDLIIQYPDMPDLYGQYIVANPDFPNEFGNSQPY